MNIESGTSLSQVFQAGSEDFNVTDYAQNPNMGM